MSSKIKNRQSEDGERKVDGLVKVGKIGVGLGSIEMEKSETWGAVLGWEFIKSRQLTWFCVKGGGHILDLDCTTQVGSLSGSRKERENVK